MEFVRLAGLSLLSMKKGIKSVTVVIFIITLSVVKSYAQPIPPSSTPLDPLSWVLLGVGGAFAGKKYYNSKFRGK